MRSRGFLVVVSGPSGAGKNTLLNAVMPLIPDLRYSVSVTTRPARPGEQDGVDYYFADDAEFDRLIDEGRFLEWAEFCGYRYGTERRFVEECLDQGQIVITDIDIQGAKQIKASMPDGVFVFVLPPSISELRTRLLHRGTEGEDAISLRLETALEELQAISYYDYWILNDDIQKASSALEAVIRAEKSRVSRLEKDVLTAKYLEGGTRRL